MTRLALGLGLGLGLTGLKGAGGGPYISAPTSVTAVEPVTNPPSFVLNYQYDELAGSVLVGDVPQLQFDSTGTIYDGAAVTVLGDPLVFSGVPELPTGTYDARIRFVRDEGGPGEVIGSWSSPSADFDVVSSYTGPDIVIVGYGQSNWLGHMNTTSSPDAAGANTRYWDGSTWSTSVPAGNGVRKLLNAIATETGLTVGIISGGQSGVNITALKEGAGTGYFEDLAADIVASGAAGASEHYIIWHQGEGDGNTASPNATTYQTNLDAIHQSIVDELGLTKAAMPLICSGLGTVTDAAFTQPDSSWAEIQAALATANDNYANIHYSHSNLDAVLDAGGVHWTAASYARSGSRYAQKVLQLRGDETTSADWRIVGVARVDATTLDVTIAHSMGTDFTAGYTGFEVSTDGGSAWVDATGARQSATVIRLTHTSISTANDVPVRFGYGKAPDVSSMPLDNGALSAPLVPSAGDTFIAEGLSSLPVPTYVTRKTSTGGGASQAFSGGYDIGANTTDTLVIVTGAKGTTPAGALLSSLTLTPNGGSPINGTIINQNTSGGTHLWMAQFIVPAGTSGANNCALALTYAANPFGNTDCAMWVVSADDLSSTTPIDSDVVGAAATSATVDISTSADGFIIATAFNNASGAQSCTWSGDEALTERFDTTNTFGFSPTGADASGTGAATNSNTVTATFAISGTTRVIAASWR